MATWAWILIAIAVVIVVAVLALGLLRWSGASNRDTVQMIATPPAASSAPAG
ncbi:MAG TPA: hypothetical protein VKB37_21455 [Jatrophihabitantaceae bacterium]|nr:hypothetical protein [Jatrophihabitantaceae bacterium]